MIRHPRKGLSSIRTRATGPGAACESSSPHSVYLKLAMLEIERGRRAKEQVASAARAATLQKRIDQIEGEVQGLQKLVAAAEGGAPGALAEESPAAIPPPEPARGTRVFRF